MPNHHYDIDTSCTSLSHKALVDFRIINNQSLGSRYSLLTLSPCHAADLQGITPLPGQFVQVLVTGVDGVMLRRPISVHNYFKDSGILQLLIARAGKATNVMCQAAKGTVYNILLPLGNTFPLEPQSLRNKHIMLVGGGVGAAPLLYYGRWLRACGATVTTILAARTAADVILEDEFGVLGDVEICTDDGSRGTKGFATCSHALNNSRSAFWAVCGPSPMMHAVSDLARQRATACYVSLENMMACGLGACLCCVQKTADGHNRCVCTEGPVFSTDTLGW